MRTLIVLAGLMLPAVSAFAADQAKHSQQPIVVASAGAKEVKKSPKAAKTEAPARVWTLEMSCCEPQ
jgi:hypothetical protein